MLEAYFLTLVGYYSPYFWRCYGLINRLDSWIHVNNVALIFLALSPVFLVGVFRYLL